jgi:hypothetical protein
MVTARDETREDWGKGRKMKSGLEDQQEDFWSLH